MDLKSSVKPDFFPVLHTLFSDAVDLLKTLISTPSFCREENHTARLIQSFLADRYVPTFIQYNNVWAYNRHYDRSKPTILLNSHHDTVRPNNGYTRDPFEPLMENDRLYGLGSNDAGGCVVSLIATFLHFFERDDLPFNLCLAITAEKEISGENGLKRILSEIEPLAFAIVGEPTGMHIAIAEPGSMVLDCIAHGRAGHAARSEGENAIYKALTDIHWFSTYSFHRESCVLDPIKMTVTEVDGGVQSNVVPAECHFTVDVRFCNSYTSEELIDIIKSHVSSTVSVRTGILKPSYIDKLHPVVRTGIALGRKTYVSPTSSDQGWLDIPSLKMGPGDSARSHTPDEYIYIDEIKQGIDIYIRLLDSLKPYLINNPHLNEGKVLVINS